MIYLDNASTTKVDERVLEAMMPYLTEAYGNPGSLCGLGREAADAVAKARSQVAELIHAQPDQIVFTSGGSEANSLVFEGLRKYLMGNGLWHIITSQIEHDSVLKATKGLIKDGFYTEYIAPSDGGSIRPAAVEEAFTDRTGFVSIMHTNNETGIENPVGEIARACHNYGILFHTDCVQAAGGCTLDVTEIGCDFLSLSAHKIHAPKGVGALYVKDRSLLLPMIYGGAGQEYGLRGGTENVAGIVGFGAACEILRQRLQEDVDKISRLKQVLYEALIGELGKHELSGIVHLNSAPLTDTGKIINLRFDNVDGETLLLLLDAKGVCASAGSACRSHESEPSHVLTAMGISAEDARNSIRLSLSRMNDEAEMYRAAKILAECAMFLRGNPA